MEKQMTGLYDSDTGKSLRIERVVDASWARTDNKPLELVYTTARRGPIVQLRSERATIHYFYDEPGGRAMIREDAQRYGLDGDTLLNLIGGKE